MKNILYLCGYAAPYKGNFIPSLETIEQQYKDGNIVYCFPHNAASVVWMGAFQKAHKVYFMPLSFFGKRIKWDDLMAFKNIIDKEGIDIVHCHFLTYCYPLYVARMTVARKCMFIGHIHNRFEIPATKSRFIKKFVMERLYDLIIGVSEDTALSVRQTIKHKNVIAIPNAVCFNRLDEYEKISLRENNLQRVVLMAGWPASVKGVDIAVKAIEHLREQGRDVVLRIMLSGDFDKTENFIREQIGQMPDWVKLLQPRQDVAAYYNAADVFLSASRTEGLSYAVIENAYCNALLCCSRLPGNSLDIPNMFIFDVGNTDGCYEALKTTLDLVKSSEYDSIKTQQRTYVERQFDINCWVEKVTEIY